MVSSDSATAGPCRLRWRWAALAWFAALTITAILSRHALLRAMAAPLVVDEPAAAVDAVVVHPLAADMALYREAAGRIEQSAGARVVLLASRPSRTARYGVLPSATAAVREQLAALEVPPGRIEQVESPIVDEWDAAEAIEQWLSQHPGTQLQLPVGYFEGSQWRLIVNRSMPPDAAQRVRITALPPQWFDEGNWWTQRRGIQLVVGQWLSMLHAALSDRREARHEPWNLEALEASLAAARTPSP